MNRRGFLTGLLGAVFARPAAALVPGSMTAAHLLDGEIGRVEGFRIYEDFPMSTATLMEEIQQYVTDHMRLHVDALAFQAMKDYTLYGGAQWTPAGELLDPWATFLETDDDAPPVRGTAVRPPVQRLQLMAGVSAHGLR